MKAAEMPTEAILEELRCCILDLDTMLEYPANARLPSTQRRMLELLAELRVRVESLEIDKDEQQSFIDDRKEKT